MRVGDKYFPKRKFGEAQRNCVELIACGRSVAFDCDTLEMLLDSATPALTDCFNEAARAEVLADFAANIDVCRALLNREDL